MKTMKKMLIKLQLRKLQLKKLQLRKIQIKKSDDFTIPRISQLTLKTNQFNLTTKRYQEEHIRDFTKSKDMIVECVHVEDKFGDSGITGVWIIKKSSKEEWYLDTFLLSCRVIGREIEKGILGSVIEKAKLEGVKKIKAQYIPTKKNKPCENFLSDCGFKIQDDYYIYNIENNAIKMLKFIAGLAIDIEKVAANNNTSIQE